MSEYQALNDNVDKFDTLLESVRKNEVVVQNLINQREAKLLQGDNLYAIDKDVRLALSSYQKSLREMQDYSQKRPTIQMLPQETQRRRNIVNELANKYTNLNSRALSKDSKIKSPQENLFDKKKSEDISLKGKSQFEMIQIQKQLQGNQDQQIDELINQVDIIGNHTKNIKVALDEDKKIMTQLSNNVAKNSDQIQSATSKLNDFLSRTSNCCLWTTIIVQLMIFIMLIIY